MSSVTPLPTTATVRRRVPLSRLVFLGVAVWLVLFLQLERLVG